jgi:hypothetical protein
MNCTTLPPPDPIRSSRTRRTSSRTAVASRFRTAVASRFPQSLPQSLPAVPAHPGEIDIAWPPRQYIWSTPAPTTAPGHAPTASPTAECPPRTPLLHRSSHGQPYCPLRIPRLHLPMLPPLHPQMLLRRLLRRLLLPPPLLHQRRTPSKPTAAPTDAATAAPTPAPTATATPTDATPTGVDRTLQLGHCCVGATSRFMERSSFCK